ncbi:MAG: DNA primase, partial [Acidobacteriota bacterium]
MSLATAYNNELVQEIEARIDIVELIGEDCELTRRGNRYWGLCPFHSEKTSSFSVSQERQLFYCFGCHEGGNIFGYIMKKRNLEFSETLAYLAEKAGIDTSRYTDSRIPKKRDIDRIVIELNQEASKFYHNTLLANQGSVALKYLRNRGVNDESIEAFGLGFALDDWRPLQQHLLDRGYSVEAMMESGLIRRSQKGDQYMDFFRNRIIFPIFNQSGHVIAFGGRLMEGEGPKYLNSAENRVFSKRNNLFGLYQGRNEIRESNEMILVEGYMDCLQLHQHGIKNAVATLGTAFTREQSK